MKRRGIGDIGRERERISVGLSQRKKRRERDIGGGREEPLCLDI